MARVNVYLPDKLAREWRLAGLNISRITQVAVEREVGWWRCDMWLRRVAVQRGSAVSHRDVLGALGALGEDAETWRGPSS